MPSRSWFIRIADLEDFAGIRKLYQYVFQHERPLEHDLWKYRDNPAGPSISMVAVEPTGSIVGHYAVLPTYLRLGKERVLGAQSFDTMTHPDYQKQGMLTVLAENCYKYAADHGVEALYGFPNKNSYPGLIRRLNWDHTGDISTWMRPLNASGLPKLPRTFSRPLAFLASHLLPAGNIGSFEIDTSEPTDTFIQNLITSWQEPQDLCRVDRDPAWLTWRYHANSKRSYEWVSAIKNGKIVASAVWGVINSGESVIADLYGDDPKGLEAAVSFCVSRAKNKGYARMRAVANEPRVVSALKACGFLNRGGLPLITRGMTSRTLGGNIHNHDAWRIISADLDTF